MRKFTNYTSEIPYKLPLNVVAVHRQESLEYVDFSLDVISRNRRLPLARLTLFPNDDVQLLRSQFYSTQLQRNTWDMLATSFGVPQKLGVDLFVYTRTDREEFL